MVNLAFSPFANGYLSSAVRPSLMTSGIICINKLIPFPEPQLFINGVESVSTGFDPSLGVENAIDSDWILGAGTISSTIDAIHYIEHKPFR